MSPIKKITFLFLLISSNIFTQVIYEPGYITFDSGNKIDCYILNVDWVNTPSEFKFKRSLNTDIIEVGNLSNVSIFGVGDKIKYIKSNVEFETSSNVPSSLSNTSEPKYTSKKTFLKQLVEGDANLYEYQDNRTQKFYFSASDLPIKELISKRYISKGKIAINDSYRRQLFDALKCSSLSLKKTRSLKYDRNNLVNYFKIYNECTGGLVKVYDNPKKGKLAFGIKLGYFNPNVEIDLTNTQFGEDRQSTELSSKSSIRVAVELEYTLPFNNNKWSLFIEPGYQSYSNSKTFETGNVTGADQTVSVDYEYIDIPIGVRHHMFLNEDSKLFLSAALVFAIDFSDIIDYEDDNEARDLVIQSGSNLFVGFGYNYLDKYSVEARFATNRNITKGESAIVRADYKSNIGLVLGYKFW